MVLCHQPDCYPKRCFTPPPSPSSPCLLSWGFLEGNSELAALNSYHKFWGLVSASRTSGVVAPNRWEDDKGGQRPPQLMHVCKDKQLLSRGSNLSLNEDTGEFCQEMIPKDIGRPSVAMATALLHSLKLWLVGGRQ